MQQGFTRFRALPIFVPNEPLNPSASSLVIYIITFRLAEIFIRNMSGYMRVYVYIILILRSRLRGGGGGGGWRGRGGEK